MNGEILLLFVILLLALILCTYLGGNNCVSSVFEGMTSNSSSTIDVSDNGASAKISTGPNQNNIITNSYDNYNHFKGTSYASIYYGPNSGTAKIIEAGNGGTVVITNKDGTTEIYYIDENTTNSDVTTYVGPNGGTAKIIKHTNGKSAVEITGPNGNKIVFTEDDIYNNNTNNIEQNSHYSGYNKDFSNFFGSTDKNTAATATSLNSSGIYNNSLPEGIPRNQIPAGQEDLYILKSQVVPPVCPAAPQPIVKCDNNNGNGEFDVSKCPPCAPCGRCKESPYECKKVPTYKAFNQDYMPVPVLNSFSTFGM